MAKQSETKDTDSFGSNENKALQRGKNWLILIAINDYEKKPLNNCVKDAKVFCETLQTRYHFNESETRRFYDKQATSNNIIKEFTKLIDIEIKENDNVVIYYSGHGRDDKLFGFCWIPIEAESGNTSLYIFRDIIIRLLIGLDGKKVRHIFMIVDSCFAGTMSNPSKADDLPEDRLESESSRWILSSARKELASDGEEGGHSPFAQTLIDILKENMSPLPIGTLGQLVKNRMINLPGVAQTPSFDRLEVTGHAGGEMVLHLREATRLKSSRKAIEKTETIDILAHLPIHAEIKYPSIPFKGLHWFEKEDARIFFGRKEETSNFHQLLDNSHDQRKRLILLYGASGTGKSSFLFAGLLPRLPQSWLVAYRRRGADGTILDILNWAKSTSPEQKAVLIIDQLEEIYTNPGTTGTAETAQLNKVLFETMNEYPQLSVVLSFREEFLGRITDLLNQPTDTYTTFALNHLNRRNIYEALTGVTNEAAQHFRGIKFEDEELPWEITQDFVSLDAKTYTPLVQYLLRRMWEGASAERGGEAPLVFTRALYKKMYRSTLRGLLDTQLEEVEALFPAYRGNGLLNDIMYLFVSADTTASSHALSDIEFYYRHLPIEDVQGICRALEDSYLLSGFTNDEGELHYRLCHDALALSVLQRFNESEEPGQKVNRFLEHALRTKTGLSEEAVLIMDIGKRGRRELKEEEQQLILLGWKKHIKSILNRLIANNNLLDALEILVEFERVFTLGYNGLILLSEYNDMRNGWNIGIISIDQLIDRKLKLSNKTSVYINNLFLEEKKEKIHAIIKSISKGRGTVLIENLKNYIDTEISKETNELQDPCAILIELTKHYNVGIIPFEDFIIQKSKAILNLIRIIFPAALYSDHNADDILITKENIKIICFEALNEAEDLINKNKMLFSESTFNSFRHVLFTTKNAIPGILSNEDISSTFYLMLSVHNITFSAKELITYAAEESNIVIVFENIAYALSLLSGLIDPIKNTNVTTEDISLLKLLKLLSTNEAEIATHFIKESILRQDQFLLKEDCAYVYKQLIDNQINFSLRLMSFDDYRFKRSERIHSILTILNDLFFFYDDKNLYKYEDSAHRLQALENIKKGQLTKAFGTIDDLIADEIPVDLIALIVVSATECDIENKLNKKLIQKDDYNVWKNKILESVLMLSRTESVENQKEEDYLIPDEISISYIKDKIAENEIAYVFILLKNLLDTDQNLDLFHNLLLVQAQYNYSEYKLKKGTIRRSEYDLEMNKTRRSLLHIIDEVFEIKRS